MALSDENYLKAKSDALCEAYTVLTFGKHEGKTFEDIFFVASYLRRVAGVMRLSVVKRVYCSCPYSLARREST